MNRSRAPLTSVLILLLLGGIQAIAMLGLDTGASTVSWSDWFGFVRDDGPIMERVPAPYVVFTILGGAAAAIVLLFLYLRFSDEGESR